LDISWARAEPENRKTAKTIDKKQANSFFITLFLLLKKPLFFPQNEPLKDLLQLIKIDDFVKSQNWDGKVKSSKFKAREFCVIR
jgi:hypothetical protein